MKVAAEEKKAVVVVEKKQVSEFQTIHHACLNRHAHMMSKENQRINIEDIFTNVIAPMCAFLD